MPNKTLKTDIAIIGAGPAGLYSAYLLAKTPKLKITVFEEHNKIGLPVKCTGLVTNSIQKILKIPKNVIQNKIEFAKIISPNAQSIAIRLKQPNLVLNRAKFDQFLARKARDSGVKIHLMHKFHSLKNKENKIIIQNNKIKNIECKIDYLIGADGPQSIVSKIINKGDIKNKFLIGIQARVKLNIKNKYTLEFYPIKRGFAWFVPESDKIARIGIACYKKQKMVFNNFLRIIEKKYKTKINKKNIIDYQAGLIPIYNPRIKTHKKINNINLYIVGDAATFVKATTAGGIIQSLLAAKTLAKSIENNKNYPKQWKKTIGKDLYIHLLIRKILDKFNNKDFDYLIKLTNQKKIKDILGKYDRDFILKLIIKIIIKEPRYLYFLSKLI